MIRNLKNFLIIVAVIYAALMIFVSEQTANFILALVLVLCPIFYVLRFIFRDKFYDASSRMTPKKFVENKYTLVNTHCIVRYVPNEKIMVFDNFSKSQRREKRTFSLYKYNGVNVAQCWNDVCKIFDEYIYFDTLVSFFSHKATVNVKLISTDENNNSQRLDDSVKQQNPNANTESISLGEIKPDEFGSNDSEKIESKPVEETKISTPTSDLISMDQLLHNVSAKINVNFADAAEIAMLPGINIVAAKKIVEYRDANGLFKSFDEFFNESGLKDHFKDKIRSLVVVSDKRPSSPKKDDGDDCSGRIVDF